jgi:hypothetical protein
MVLHHGPDARDSSNQRRVVGMDGDMQEESEWPVRARQDDRTDVSHAKGY